MKLWVLVPETEASWPSPAASHDGQLLPPEAMRRGDKKGKPTKVTWQGFEPLALTHGTPLQYSCLENPWMEEPGGL